MREREGGEDRDGGEGGGMKAGTMRTASPAVMIRFEPASDSEPGPPAGRRLVTTGCQD